MQFKTAYFRVFGAMLLLNYCGAGGANPINAASNSGAQRAGKPTVSRSARPASTPAITRCSVFESTSSPGAKIQIVLTSGASVLKTNPHANHIQIDIFRHSGAIEKRLMHYAANGEGVARLSRALSRIAGDAANWKNRDVGFREERIALADGFEIRFCQDESRKQEVALQYDTPDGTQKFIFNDTAQLLQLKQSIDAGMGREGVPST